MVQEIEKREVFILSPFEIPDVRLALETIKAGAFPILHLGRNGDIAAKCLKTLSQKTKEQFGVCIVSEEMKNIPLPENVSKLILPYGMNYTQEKGIEILYQVHSFQEAQNAIKEKLPSIIVKGYEGAGRVAKESSFILFQKIAESCKKAKIKVYIQGGAGLHTSAAFFALGAQGVIFDSQIVAFPECSVPKEIKDISIKLSGSETVVVDNFRVLHRNTSPVLPVDAVYDDLQPFLGGYSLSENYLPVGQDISLSVDFLRRHKKLKNFVFAVYSAAHGHILQAKNKNVITPDNGLAKDLGTKYPIGQGPMARISDVPEFLKEVADAGALPILSLSMAVGQEAKDLLETTDKLLKNQTWGVGFFGFNFPHVRDEQTKLILEVKPKVVLIAGGRPSLAKPFEDVGIKTFIHVPSSSLLDLYIKEGAKDFVFEGRESGGHIGPLGSLVLWEKQIFRLLQEEDLSHFSVFFAGGIHDALSSAFISVMAASLAAQGTKVGIWMGTSYLYTEEIVKTGAITPEYQNLVVKTQEMVLLESSPGMVSRAVKTPFTELFLREKKKKVEEGAGSPELGMYLEDLIIGRTRIAAKGKEFKDNGWAKLTLKEQREKGLFLTGEVTLLTNKTTTIENLHKSVIEDNNTLISELPDIQLPAFLSRPADIAIIGMDCIFPKAKNIEEFWTNIFLAKDCIEEIPDIRLNKSLFYKPDSTDSDFISCKTGGFVPTVDFDPMEFGMTPQSLTSVETTQLLSLMIAKRALKDAGYSDISPDVSENVSVIFGSEGLTDLAARVGFRSTYRQIFGELPDELKERLPRLTTDTFAGLLSNITPGRISNRLNLKGRNYSINAACASSLTALSAACQELSSYEADMVVLGGDDFHNNLNDYMMFSSTHALSRKGYCGSFDAGADGMTMGEGVGVAILKRLEDAERDGDKIYAVIKGVGGSSDGKGMSLTAPTAGGQITAMEKAYQSAGISPSEVGLIEAHGTGTVVGDKTEISSSTKVLLEAGALVGQTSIGTVKSQIGHTKCAAGISGLIRATLSVYYGVIPPTIHLENPLDNYNSKTSPFVFNTRPGIWTKARRISGISAFGFGGANFHAVIENYKPEVPFTTILKTWPSELFVFRGDTLEEAKQQVGQVKSLLTVNADIPLKNIAFTLASATDKVVQVSVVASDAEDLLSKIEIVLSGKDGQNIYYRKAIDGKVAFLFSGQGSQRVNMARDLFVAFPKMRSLLSQNSEYEKIIFPSAVFDIGSQKALNEAITDTRNSQPLLGIVDYAIASYLRFLGIEPDLVAGHSYGELPALCFAGAFKPEKLVALSRKRAESILGAIEDDKGKMLAVAIPEEKLNELLQDETEVWAVNFNSTKQTVLAGTTPGLTAFMEKLTAQNIAFKEINVACAFHSPLLAQSKDLYAEVLKNVSFHRTTIPVWSNTTAELYPKNAVGIRERLTEHLIKPVLFSKEVQNMYAEGARIFIETGPGNVLNGLVQDTLGSEIVTIQTEAKEKEGLSFLLNALAQYLATGKYFDVQKLFVDRETSTIDIAQVEKYAKSKTVWRVNGQYSYPNEGKLPRDGALPFAEPIRLSGSNANLPQVLNTNAADSSEKIMLEYLDGVKSLIQNQRDVLLGYFGQNPQEFRPRKVEYQTVEEPSRDVQAKPNQIKEQVPVQVPENKPSDVLSTEQIRNILLEVVSEKTGYPIDMLGLDMDLEADLSIDSIKRMEIVGELKDKMQLSGDFENSEETFMKMASIKTLNELTAWIGELRESMVVATPAVVSDASQVQTGDAPTGTESAQLSLTIEEIKVILLEVVSEKTGYPIDMLGLDMDLEADLSIDSIKRMEIVGELKDKLHLSGEFENSEETFMKMASLKTLNELIAWLDELLHSETGEAAAVEEEQQKETVATEENKQLADLSRILFELQAHPLSQEKISIAGKRFAITKDGGRKPFATKIKTLLESQGASVSIITASDPITSFDGLILLNSVKSPNKYTMQDFFNLIKQKDVKQFEWIFTFSDVIGDIAENKDLGQLKNIQGFAGLVKSLKFEYPKVNFRTVISYSLFDAQTLPQIVLDELTVDELFPEIIYKGKERFRNEIKMEDIDKNETPTLALDKDSVVVVLGGAQGISPELVYQLSTDYPCRYILVGRSNILPDESGVYATLKTQADIRKHLIANEQMKVPTEIEKKIRTIFKSNQISEAIKKIEQSGATVTYQSLDVSDTEVFKNFLQQIRAEYGKIDAVIHAAGILHDKFFADKTWESFEKVYNTKRNPLHVILDELQDDLKLLVLFSSVASAYGSVGQGDYAAANSVFDLAATALPVLSPNLRTVSFNWGPWKGAGMVSSMLEAEFTKKGVSMIPLKEGGALFANELKFGNESRISVMGRKDEVENFLKLIQIDNER
ncbi:MAG: SDR family NAD(P)-dependent oxidoreductase [Dysgonamonadaceae bacterium]|jgi:acyl transferase domain-containing protein/NAD(P)H-dependent flavin oxidoreductase YrpB (nitropropane dioxygenase family)/NAD(P)-dependent dehydrogenase (short-subunit alcohol dehydrogenase family)|nr:SDR family NAD(P)-dependent oxidoreductase [Dysgonamonadaceae bacterium]